MTLGLGSGSLARQATFDSAAKLCRVQHPVFTSVVGGGVTHHRGGVPGFPRDKLAIASAFQPQGMAVVIAETRSITATMAAARTATDLGDRPLVVLTGLRPMTERERTRRKMTEGQATAIRAIWDTLQRAEAGWSSAGRQVRVLDAGHYVQFDRPDLVIAAVREVVDSVRARAAASH